MIPQWAKRLSATVGVAGGVVIAAVFLALLPFNLVAVTRLTGWEIAIAAAAVIALNLVPIAGQLVYVGLAVLGAFYLGEDNLAARRAAPATVAAASAAPSKPTSAPSAVASSPPTENFSDWKKNVAAPAVQSSCVNDAQRRGLVEGEQIEKMARACACYGAAAVNVITPEDVEDGRVKPTPEFNERLSNEARRICQG